MKEKTPERNESRSYASSAGEYIGQSMDESNITPIELTEGKDFQVQHVINVKAGLEIPSLELIITLHDRCGLDAYRLIRMAYEMDLKSSPESQTSLGDIDKKLDRHLGKILETIKKVRPSVFED